MGFDDLRPLSFYTKGDLPIYADDATADTIERVFEYTFRKKDRYPTSARVQVNRIDPTPGAGFDLLGLAFSAFRLRMAARRSRAIASAARPTLRT